MITIKSARVLTGLHPLAGSVILTLDGFHAPKNLGLIGSEMVIRRGITSFYRAKVRGLSPRSDGLNVVMWPMPIECFPIGATVEFPKY